jgi:DNA ligase (NAD+)
MDGCGLANIYKNGKLKESITRGNGIKGDVVTENAKMINGIPTSFSTKDNIEIRGEVIFPKSEFEKATNNGEDLKNCRNTASGAVKLHNPKEVKKRNLVFYGYTVINGNNKTQEQDIKLLKKCGFKTVCVCVTDSINKILSVCDKMATDRKKLDFDIDGMVIKVNDKKLQKKLGNSATNPKFAVAYKFPNEEVYPKIKKVIFQVGRTGAITPVALYEPQMLCGTTVKKASLHNADIINKLKICIGDTVVVVKKGEIIPQVVGLKKKGTKRIPIEFPKKCPMCGCTTRFIGAKLYCTYETCASRVIGNISSWCSKKNMNIDGVSSATIKALYEKGLVKNVADLYSLTKKQLLKVEGIKDKSATNIINAIEKSKQAGLSKVISGLGIDTIGNTIAEELAGKFKTLKALANASVNELSDIETVGEVKAKNIVRWFKNNKSLIKKLYEIDGLVLGEKKAKKVSNSLKGKTFCITGTLSMSRDNFQALIKANGGIPVSSISRKTDFLIVGVNGGSKLSKAEKLGIETITEAQFNKMCK